MGMNCGVWFLIYLSRENLRNCWGGGGMVGQPGKGNLDLHSRWKVVEVNTGQFAYVFCGLNWVPLTFQCLKCNQSDSGYVVINVSNGMRDPVAF